MTQTNYSLKMREQRINKILKKEENNRCFEEKVFLIYFKRDTGQKITYEEYVMLTMTNDEIWFYYNDTEYQIDHGLPGKTAMYITKYSGNEKVSERSENFASVVELLEKFRVEGKRISDIWEDVTFN